jgi:hypothetical protein
MFYHLLSLLLLLSLRYANLDPRPLPVINALVADKP